MSDPASGLVCRCSRLESFKTPQGIAVSSHLTNVLPKLEFLGRIVDLGSSVPKLSVFVEQFVGAN